MAAGYVETPLNVSEISDYVVLERHALVSAFLHAGRIFFYDTCSFRRHANMTDPECIFEFIRQQNGLLIITRCVLMELASHSGILNQEYVRYFEQLHRSNVKVLLVYEEDFWDVLECCFSTNLKINGLLSRSVKVVKSSVGTVDKVLRMNKGLAGEILEGDSADGTLFRRFFAEARRHKEADDNLGEELICICLHMLSNLPDAMGYRYLVLTDDKGAIGWLNRTALNVSKHTGRHAFSVLSTTRLAQRLFEAGLLAEKDEVEAVLEAAAVRNQVKIIGSGRYDLEPKELLFDCRKLAEAIVEGSIHINY